ncbi:MAG: VOC family protein [Bacteroidota bacterium]
MDSKTIDTMPIIDIWAKTFQICWVTNDLDRAMKELKEKFDIPKFLVIRDVSFDETLYKGKVEEEYRVDAAWANGDNFNLELVQPLEGFPVDLYGAQLPKDSYSLQFHHMGVRFDNDLEGYESAVASLKAKGFEQVVDSGITGISKFSYFDMRDLLGHYLEVIWFNQEGVDFMSKLVTGDFDGE